MKKPVKIMTLGTVSISLGACTTCGSSDAGEFVDVAKLSAGAGSISRWVDEEKDTTCWIYSSARRGDISCIPNEQP